MRKKSDSEISRVGSTDSGYFDGKLIDSQTETGALTTIGFVLQNFQGNDAIKVSYANFSVSTSAMPEPTGVVLLGHGVGGVAGLGWRRRPRACFGKGGAGPDCWFGMSSPVAAVAWRRPLRRDGPSKPRLGGGIARIFFRQWEVEPSCKSITSKS